MGNSHQTISRRSFLGTLVGFSGLTLLGLPLYGRAGQRLVMHYGNNLDPLSYLMNGTMQGLLIDLMNASIRDRMGLEVEHRGYPWARAQQLVAMGEGDGICTNPTPARKVFANFSKKTALTIHFDLYYNLGHSRREAIEMIHSLQDLTTFHIVDFKGNNHAKRLYGKGCNVFWANDPKMIMQTLKEFRRDIYIGNPLYANKLIKEMGLTNVIGRRPVRIMPPSEYHLGIRNDYPNVIEILNRFDEVIVNMEADGTIEGITSKYF